MVVVSNNVIPVLNEILNMLSVSDRIESASGEGRMGCDLLATEVVAGTRVGVAVVVIVRGGIVVTGTEGKAAVVAAV